MDNLRGIMLMIGAMACFAFEDMFIKLSAETMPTGQVILATGLFGAACFGVVAVMRGERLLHRDVWLGAAGLRNLGELLATGGFVTSLALAPLSLVAAILQAQPLALTCCAALFLGEKVGWRRWSAIGIGFVGVLIIIRPGSEGFRPEALWAVIGVLGLTLRDLATRSVPKSVGSVSLGFSALGIVCFLGAAMMFAQGGVVIPDNHGALMLVGTVISGTIGYVAVVAACRVGEMSVVMPFRYTRLVFVLILGVVLLGERPGMAVLGGAALVIGSGVYTLLRERALRKNAIANTG